MTGQPVERDRRPMKLTRCPVDLTDRFAKAMRHNPLVASRLQNLERDSMSRF
jgi:hypothetical protein